MNGVQTGLRHRIKRLQKLLFEMADVCRECDAATRELSRLDSNLARLIREEVKKDPDPSILELFCDTRLDRENSLIRGVRAEMAYEDLLAKIQRERTSVDSSES